MYVFVHCLCDVLRLSVACVLCVKIVEIAVVVVFFFLMIRRPPRSTLDRSSAASDVYKRQAMIRRLPAACTSAARVRTASGTRLARLTTAC